MVNVNSLEEHLEKMHGVRFNWENYGQDDDSPVAVHNMLHWHKGVQHDRENLGVPKSDEEG